VLEEGTNRDRVVRRDQTKENQLQNVEPPQVMGQGGIFGVNVWVAILWPLHEGVSSFFLLLVGWARCSPSPFVGGEAKDLEGTGTDRGQNHLVWRG